MRKLSFSASFSGILGVALPVVSTILVAGCSFRVGSRPEPTPPVATAPPAARPPTSSGTPGNAGKPAVALGRVKPLPAGAAQQPGAVPATPATPATPGIPVLAGTNVFGQGTPDATGWKGSYFVLPAATQKLPALGTMTPNGVLFAKELNVPAKAMTGGFPGIDAARNENFALRWEAPLIVDTEADYTFRIVSDDGAIVSIDQTPIVDNDGAHGPQEKSGPVHLVKGTHGITVDYFQTTGGVALQLFCKKAGGAEVICPTHLL